MKIFLLNILLFSLSNLYSQTEIDKTIYFDGLTRIYRLYIPQIYTGNSSVPLVFSLHGYGSDNLEQESYADFRPVADTANFIIALPNGTIDSYGYNSWNSYDLNSVNDIGFINALIDTIITNYNIDTNKIYCCGLSNGAFMSYDVGCYLSNRISAIASVAGSMIQNHVNNCTPLHSLPVMEIHGTSDAVVPYNGYTSFLPVDTVINYWKNFNNCNFTPIVYNFPDINTTDGCTATKYTYLNQNNISVELIKIINGGHSWPGAPVNLNITNMDFNACIEIWKFFRKYNLSDLSNVTNNSSINIFQIYPNPAKNIFFVYTNIQGRKKITVYNSLGEKVFFYFSESAITKVSIQNSGLYIISIESDKINYNQKLIINEK